MSRNSGELTTKENKESLAKSERIQRHRARPATTSKEVVVPNLVIVMTPKSECKGYRRNPRN